MFDAGRDLAIMTVIVAVIMCLAMAMTTVLCSREDVKRKLLATIIKTAIRMEVMVICMVLVVWALRTLHLI